MNIVAKGYRLVIKQDELDDLSDGQHGTKIAIVRTKHEQASVQTGRILSVGPEAWKAFGRDVEGRPAGKPWAKVGDRIVYSQYAPRKFVNEVTEEEVAFINDEDVIAVIED